MTACREPVEGPALSRVEGPALSLSKGLQSKEMSEETQGFRTRAAAVQAIDD